MISVELAKELAKYLPWEPKVGDLTIVYGDGGAEIIEPIIPKHEKEKKSSYPCAILVTWSGFPG